MVYIWVVQIVCDLVGGYVMYQVRVLVYYYENSILRIIKVLLC